MNKPNTHIASLALMARSQSMEASRHKRLLKAFVVLALFALLGIAEIVFWILGVADPGSPRAWIALIGAVAIVSVFAFLIIATVYGSLLKRRRRQSPTHTLTDSPVTLDSQRFEALYAVLLEQITALPRTGSEKEWRLVGRLRNAVTGLIEVEAQLKRMSGTRQYKEDLRELEIRVHDELMSLLDMLPSRTLLHWLRTRHSEFDKAFRDAVSRAIELGEILRKSLVVARAKPK